MNRQAYIKAIDIAVQHPLGRGGDWNLWRKEISETRYLFAKRWSHELDCG